MQIYEDYTVEELILELANVSGIECKTSQARVRKEAREVKLLNEITKRRENMAELPEYTAEMTIVFEVGKASMAKFLDILRAEILSSENVTVESLIVTKK